MYFCEAALAKLCSPSVPRSVVLLKESSAVKGVCDAVCHQALLEIHSLYNSSDQSYHGVISLNLCNPFFHNLFSLLQQISFFRWKKMCQKIN